jgi:hypothetical protein
MRKKTRPPSSGCCCCYETVLYLCDCVCIVSFLLSCVSAPERAIYENFAKWMKCTGIFTAEKFFHPLRPNISACQAMWILPFLPRFTRFVVCYQCKHLATSSVRTLSSTTDSFASEYVMTAFDFCFYCVMLSLRVIWSSICAGDGATFDTN